MRCWLALRSSPQERVQCFVAGAKRYGLSPVIGQPKGADERDVLVTWNRIRTDDAVAESFPGSVLVAENATWGNGFAADRWLTLCRDHHNLRGNAPVGGPERFDGLGIRLGPLRRGGETLILPSRGIGPRKVAMPASWTDAATKTYRGRVRAHPGRNAHLARPLVEDLAGVSRVVTWGSGAAVTAAIEGCEVISELQSWIGEHKHTEEDRLRMLRELAWAQSRLSEIESGEAFARLLEWRP